MKVRKFLTVIAVLATTFSSVLTPAVAVHAASASLYLSPAAKSVNEGDSFTVGLYVSADVNINAAEATLTFPVNILNVTAISKNGIFTTWAAGPSYSNSTGRITFTGGLPSPGYKGSAGRIFNITFLAKTSGKATVQITGGSVAQNNEFGTEVLRSQGSGTYTVSKPVVPPPEPPKPSLPSPGISDINHSDQENWYQARAVTAKWVGGTGVQGYSLVYDDSPSTIPPDIVTTTSVSYSKADAPDGTHYLHVKAKYAGGWSATSHFKFQIDATPPEKFVITIVGDPQLNFSTSDATSGVDRYEVSLDGGPFTAATSPYQTPDLAVGSHTVVVRAYDKAGNMTEATATFEITGYPQPIIIDLTPVLTGYQPIIIHGFSNAQDSIRLTIGDDTFGPYKVSDNLDPNPPQPPPDGKVAWKLEVTPRNLIGDHEVTFVAIGPNGRVSDATPPFKFKIQPLSVNLLGATVPLALALNLLLILVLLLLIVAGIYAILYYRLRHQALPVLKKKKKKENQDTRADGTPTNPT